MELVLHNRFDTVKFCFLAAGHAKFDQESLFSTIAHAYNHSDVFITEQLVALIQNTIEPNNGKCISIDNQEVINWKDLLQTKYNVFENIKNCREFFVKRDANNNTLVFHKTCCYEGDYLTKQLLKSKIDACMDLRKRLKEFSYCTKQMSTELLSEKMQDLCKMFNAYINPVLRPKWLPMIKNSHDKSCVIIGSPSAELAKQHRYDLKKNSRKKRKTQKEKNT